jgi:protein-tyrosine phosphatase
MVDIHCHILPETDDGPKTWEAAEEMLRIAAADGIEHIVATPHADDQYTFDRAQCSATLERLRGNAPKSMQFSLGCDFHFSYDNVQDALVHPARYVIGATPYLLLEFSDYAISPVLLDVLGRMREAGLVPVITHPERNLLMQRSPGEVLRLVECGCPVQVTASSVTGGWGEGARRAALWLLEHDAVHALASDAHSPQHRPPRLSSAREAVAQHVGGDVARALVEDNPRAIIAGLPLPYFPKPVLRS